MRIAGTILIVLTVFAVVFVIFPDGTSDHWTMRASWRFRQGLLVVGVVALVGAGLIARLRKRRRQ